MGIQYCMYWVKPLGDFNGQESRFRFITRPSVLGHRQHGVGLHPAELLPLRRLKIKLAISRQRGVLDFEL